MSGETEVTTSTLAETANFIAWKATEPDGEPSYHLELGTVTLHFFLEEWKELIELTRQLPEV